MITERALFRRIAGRMVLTGIAPDSTVEAATRGIPDSVEVARDLEEWEVGGR
jgi:hypothetical protein